MARARKIKGIDCSGATGDGIRLVLDGRFSEMSRFRDAALNWNDPEGVHSMRVASRRLRSALRDIRTAIDAGSPDQVKDALRQTISLVDKMAAKKLIHRNTAGRYKSRLASRVAKKSAAA